MFAVLVNGLAVIAGSLIGLIFKKGIPEKIINPIMTGIALCVSYIGISGMMCGENALIVILSMVLGVAVGTILDIDGKFNALGDTIEAKIGNKGGNKGDFSKGFVNASLIFCVGAMAVVGSINAGISNDNTVLYTKSLIDGISSIMFTASMGIGVMFSALAVVVYQGIIALLAGVLSPVLTESAINEMSCVGYILILVIGLNMLKITKIKIADFMPAIVFAPIIVWVFSLF